MNVSYLSARCSAPGLILEINIKCICKHLSTLDSSSPPGARHRADACPRKGETERKNDWFSPFPLKQKQELWRTDGLWECQCRCVRGLWWVWSEWARQTVHFHCTRTHSHVPRKWSGRGGEISLNDYPTPGISVQKFAILCCQATEWRQCSFSV